MYLYLSVILFVTSSVLTKITNPYDSSCSYNEFECGDGGCVSIDRVCNGIEDCSGAEDETVCYEIPAKFGLHSSRRRRQTSNCKKSEWRCRDGTCISFDGKCDGVVDCPDSSDETHALCGKTTCQSNWFRCTYGACVDGTAPCNGIQECADNSDELLPQCRGNEVADATNLRDKFKCADGNVIPATAFCDGVADCPDGSDETVQACAGRTCPAYLFQCAYGACVDAGSDCNGIKECADGSDESDELCDRVLSGKPTQKPSASGGCVLPQYPAHGSYVVLNTPNATPGQTFDSIQVNVTCKPGYGVMGRNDVFCLNGWWSDKLPQCVRFCTLNSHASVEYKCLLTNGNEGTRPCGSLEPTGTIVQPQCRSPNYYSTVPLGYMRCIEGNWDYVATCTPGLSRNGTNVTVLIKDKVEIYISNLEYTVSVGAGIGKGDDSKGDNGDVIGKGDGKGDDENDHEFDIDEGDWRIAPAKVNKKVKPLMVDFVNSTKDKIYFRD